MEINHKTNYEYVYCQGGNKAISEERLTLFIYTFPVKF